MTDQYAWKNRVVLYFVESIDGPSAKQQMLMLGEDQAGFNERAIKKFVITNTAVFEFRKNELFVAGGAEESKVLKQEKQVKNLPWFILLGKDTGVKLATSDYVPKQQLFDLIDSMPMRKREIRKRH